MGYSFSEDTGDGIKVTFPFTFTGPNNGYFDEDDIKVEVDGIDTVYTLTGPTQVTLTVAPIDGAKVRILRRPPTDAPYTDFERGNSFGKQNINRSFQQQLYLMHRTMDGFKEEGSYEKQNKSMGNYRLLDLADGIGLKDAATVEQMGDNNAETLAYKNAAEAAAIEASTSASNASTSEINAGNSESAAAISAGSASTSAGLAEAYSDAALISKDAANNSAIAAAASRDVTEGYRDEALISKNSAALSASNASISEGNAATSESNAGTSETNAATSASNALISANNAGTSETNAAASALSASNSADAADASATSILASEVAIGLNTTHRTTTTGNPHSVTKSEVGLGNVPNIDTTNADNITTGTLPNSVLPKLAITTTKPFASEAAMLAWAEAEEGDMAIRTDLIRTTYVRLDTNVGDITDWVELMSPTEVVTAVNGSSGNVSLSQDNIPDGGTYVRTVNDYNNIDKTKVDYLTVSGAVNLDNVHRGVNVKDFGAVGDGVANDRDAILNAATSLGTGGGTVYFPDGKFLIDTALTLPDHITLKGPFEFNGGGYSSDYNNVSALIINTSITLTLGSSGAGGTGIVGMLIRRKGGTFPITSESGFAGTAITFNGDDCFVHNSMILGFNKLIYSNGHQRPHIMNLLGDGINGIEINNCMDIGRFMNVHLWPFAIYPFAGDYKRSGIAFNLTNGGDWNKLTDCFCWGYRYGYVVDSCNSVTFLNCGADGPKEDTLSIGFSTLNTSTDTRLIGCQSAGQNTGYVISTGDTYNTRLIDCDSWGCIDHCILINGGSTAITGGMLRDTANGVTSNNANAKIHITDIKNLCTVPWNKYITPTEFSKGLTDVGDGWEEDHGLWTPTITFGGNSTGVTYNTWNAGLWMKTGKMVTLTGQLAVNNKGTSTGDVVIKGLPYLPIAHDSCNVAVTLNVNGATYTGTVQGFITNSTGGIGLTQVSTGGVYSNLTNANITNGCTIQFNVTFRTFNA